MSVSNDHLEFFVDHSSDWTATPEDAKELLARRKAAEVQAPCEWDLDSCPVCEALKESPPEYCPGWPDA